MAQDTSQELSKLSKDKMFEYINLCMERLEDVESVMVEILERLSGDYTMNTPETN